jgi:hypothetical protein
MYIAGSVSDPDSGFLLSPESGFFFRSNINDCSQLKLFYLLKKAIYSDSIQDFTFKIQEKLSALERNIKLFKT